MTMLDFSSTSRFNKMGTLSPLADIFTRLKAASFEMTSLLSLRRVNKDIKDSGFSSKSLIPSSVPVKPRIKKKMGYVSMR